MYVALLMIFLVLAAALVYLGSLKRKIAIIAIGCIIGLFTVFFFWLLGFWGEFLWFEAIGYSQRFWKVIFSKTISAAVGALLGLAIVTVLTSGIIRKKKLIGIIASILGGVVGGNWGLVNWDTLLKYINGISTDLKDPILGKNTGFYLFSLPFYDALYVFFFSLAFISLAAVVISHFLEAREGEIKGEQSKEVEYRSLYISAAALVLVLAGGKQLARYHLMYSTWGAVTGPGLTDVHVRLPAYAAVVILTGLFALLLLIEPARRRLHYLVQKLNPKPEYTHLATLGTAGIVLFATWFVALSVIPGLFQWLRVEPNEITLEKPYITHNIRFTRHGFRLHKVEEKEFPVTGRFTEETVQTNQNLFANVRLWDWRALDAVYKQFQEIRLYYEFSDVDIDRYSIGDNYRQVMVSAREMQPANLPKESQTFVNRRFKYTHGYGITLTTVNEFTSEGLPDLLIKDIPPKSDHEDLKVGQPQIYYGELTDSYVVANSNEKEFDYPRGAENVYLHYPGKGGVLLQGLWRKFVFGWKFEGTRFLLSGYPRPESRIMFHRQVRERVKTLAPFLQFDADPYIVLVDGRLHWIIDGYTTTNYYPYSEPFSSRETIEYKEGNATQTLTTSVAPYLDEVNYVRNSVKAVVDAFEGSVNFYIFDGEDPIIQVWHKVFPQLFKSKEEMPADLLSHVRYPHDMLLVQGLVYAKYHMTDPAVFYNQEDLWIRATEKYYNSVQPVNPYYIMWEPPSSSDLEFVLMLPFTPKNRQVLISWIAGMCDPANYGRFLAYKFPKEKRVLGTQQVETKIDQDRFLSGQLSLWDQRGSNVIRGNVLAIPVEDTLLYVEPIYLQAETAAYPELRMVALMHKDNLSYAESFDKALRGLFEQVKPELKLGKEVVSATVSSEELIRQASEAFDEYVRLLGEKRFAESSDALEILAKTLRQLTEQIDRGEE
jgi:hypothetical protein